MHLGKEAVYKAQEHASLKTLATILDCYKSQLVDEYPRFQVLFAALFSVSDAARTIDSAQQNPVQSKV